MRGAMWKRNEEEIKFYVELREETRGCEIVPGLKTETHSRIKRQDMAEIFDLKLPSLGPAILLVTRIYLNLLYTYCFQTYVDPSFIYSFHTFYLRVNSCKSSTLCLFLSWTYCEVCGQGHDQGVIQLEDSDNWGSWVAQSVKRLESWFQFRSRSHDPGVRALHWSPRWQWRAFLRFSLSAPPRLAL